MANETKIIPIAAAQIAGQIFMVRGEKVILDTTLAALYGVETRVLIQAVKRNQARFPADFMFQLNDEEQAALRSQSVISNSGRGGRRYAPYVFTGFARKASSFRAGKDSVGGVAGHCQQT